MKQTRKKIISKKKFTAINFISHYFFLSFCEFLNGEKQVVELAGDVNSYFDCKIVFYNWVN